MSSQNRGEETAVYRFGIVGYGWLGGVIGGQIRDHERATVVGVTDVTAEARRRLVESLEGVVYVDAEISQPYMELFGGTWQTNPSLSGGNVTYDTGNHLIDGLL